LERAISYTQQKEKSDASVEVLRLGFVHQEAADMLGLSRRAADRLWLLARTWLFRAMSGEEK
jgi:hypothetical protein